MKAVLERLLHAVLLLPIAGALAAAFVLEIPAERPNPPPAVITDMMNSPAYEAQEPNPVFADGKTLQHPPEGTVARGFLPLPAGPEDVERAGELLVNPFRDDPEVLARGEAVFNIYCAACHGLDGLGQTPVVARGFPPPPSLLDKRVRDFSDGRIFHILTYGQNNMPSYAAQITREDRWKVVRYLRRLQAEE